jgi:hypothetical protein
MTDQNFRDRFYFFEKNKRDNQGANIPIANSVSLDNKSPGRSNPRKLATLLCSLLQ